ncbi:hypothetical protein [Pectinatus frisingensis]|uniref:hypothetical protein n=1 Tax=Pectinatus frisingensis TaxID=865 RepID=UPI0018C5CE6D|nr:hypothetical protein [Pectinatus frisingensis]
MSEQEQKRNELLEKLNKGVVKLNKFEDVSVNEIANKVFTKATAKKTITEKDCTKKINLYGNILRRKPDLLATSLAAASNASIQVVQVNLDTTYTINNFTTGTIALQVNTDNIKKITSYVNFSEAVNFGVGIAQANSPGSLNILEAHSATFGTLDIDSYLTNGGNYYVLIEVAAGGGTCTVLINSSTTVSSNEPNDVPSELKTIYTDVVNIHDTFDNVNDYDFIHYKLTKDTAIFFHLIFPSYLLDGKLAGVIQLGYVKIADKNGNVIRSQILKVQNLKVQADIYGAFSDILGAGEYCFYVTPNSDKPDFLNIDYNFMLVPISKETMLPSYINIISETNKNPDGYGSFIGKRWVRGDVDIVANVEGKDDNTFLPNIPIVCDIVGPSSKGDSKGDYLQMSNGISDSKGVFSTSLPMPFVHGQTTIRAAASRYAADEDSIW